MGRAHFFPSWVGIKLRRRHLALVFAGIALLTISIRAQTQDQGRQQAMTLEQQGNFADAETAWRAILKTHPSSAEAYAHLGLLEARQERYKQAVPLYRKALELHPAIPGLRLNLGLALFKGGELKPALAEFQRLLKTEAPGSEQSLRLTMLVGMARHEGYAVSEISMRQGNAGVGGAAGGRGDTGHHGEVDRGLRQRFQFFAAAAEDERVAALAAHHALALAGVPDQQLVDFLLAGALAAGGFADAHALGVTTSQIEYGGRYQAIVENNVRVLQGS